MGFATDTLRRLPRLLRKGRFIAIGGFALALFVFSQSGVLRDVKGFTRLRETLEKLEQDSIDFRFKWRGARPAGSQVALIGITSTSQPAGNFRESDLADSEALRLMTERDFPWNRKLYALVIEKLVAAGAKAIVFDLLFVREAEGDPDLRAAIERHASKIVLASTISEQAEAAGQRELTFLRPHSGLVPETETPIIAYAFHRPEPDNVIRRVDHRTSLLREHGLAEEGDDLSGLAALAVEKAFQRQPPPGYRLPIGYRGPAGTIPVLPIEEMFIDSIYQRDPRFAGGAAFKDRIVFVGPVAEVFHDVHNTPFGTMPGVEIHAQIAADLADSALLTDSPARQNWWITFGFFVFPALIVLGMRSALAQAALLAALGGAYAVVAQQLFTDAHLVLPLVPPLFGLVVVGSVGVVYQFSVEQLERRRIRSVLDRYVSRNVANVVVEDAVSFEQSLRGERKCATVLFSDVRGFTSIFETTEPVQLVEQLNEYFRPMVDIVLRQQGTLQKFIGDAIMAVWGDTHSDGLQTDAARGVRAALAMREALAKLNEGWKDNPRRIQLRVGIGINHGDVVVGNIGHPQRMEFTVLGDAINLAARLESATKQFHCDALVGEQAEALTRGEFVYRRVDRLRLKGKQRPVEVFIPLSSSSVPAPEWLASYHEAIAIYRERDFARAATLFRKVNARLGGDDFLCGMYADRCAELVQSPPPEDWDGSHTLTEK